MLSTALMAGIDQKSRFHKSPHLHLHIFISHRPDNARPGATGYAIPGYQATVLDEEGRPCAPGQVGRLVEEVGAADLVVVACPTYKGTFTGLLKLFLDRFAGGTGLRGVALLTAVAGVLAGKFGIREVAEQFLSRPIKSE